MNASLKQSPSQNGSIRIPVSWIRRVNCLACLMAACLTVSHARANPLDPWVWRNPLPTGNTFGGVAYGNGCYVAVDDAGLIATSQDTTNWSIQTVGSGQAFLTGVVYAQNLFVAVGSDNTSLSIQRCGVFTSPDGTNWTSQLAPSSIRLSAISYGSNEFVATGLFGALLISQDGTNWTDIISGTTQDLWGTAYGTNGFVVVGNGGTLMRSTDGISWANTIVPTNVIQGINLSAVVFATNQYVAVGQEGIVLTSPDAVTWTKRANPASTADTDLDAICYGDGLFVAVGGTIQTSPDAIHWTPHGSPTAFNLTSVVYANPVYIAVGVQGAIVTSTTATSWASQSAAFPADWLLGVAYGNNRFVAVGAYFSSTADNGIGGYTFWTSTDGAHWIRHSASSPNWLLGVGYGKNEFVAVGENGLILTSPTGTGWITSKTGTDDNFNAVTYGSNMFVTVGQGGDIRTSPDGIVWTAQTPQKQSTLTGVAYGNNQYVAVGYSGTVVTSPDGTNWTSQTPETTGDLNGIAFGAGVFVTVGGFNTVITSSDGVSWNKTPYPISEYIQAARAVTYGYGNFVTVGDQGAIQVSPDGYTWSGPTFTTDENLYGVCAGYNGYLAITDTGGILQSDDSVVPPVLGPLVYAPGGLPQGSVASVPGQTYMIQASSDLINWVTVTNVTLNSTNGQFIDPTMTNYPQRFYRAAGP
jgi:hypothetical protein